MYCKQSLNPEDDLKHCVEKLFSLSEESSLPEENCDATKLPQVLWSLYFTCTDVSFEGKDMPKNIYSCGGPDLDLDYDNAVKQVIE